MLAAADLFEAVRCVELDGGKRGINVDGGGARGDGRGFGGPEQRRADPLSGGASPEKPSTSPGPPGSIAMKKTSARAMALA